MLNFPGLDFQPCQERAAWDARFLLFQKQNLILGHTRFRAPVQRFNPVKFVDRSTTRVQATSANLPSIQAGQFVLSYVIISDLRLTTATVFQIQG